LKNNKFCQGQSIVEVLFAIGVVSICLLALIVVITAAVSNTRFSKSYNLATKYANEGVEMARKERDRNNWTDFIAAYQNDVGLDDSLTWGDCGSANVDSIYERCINFFQAGEVVTVTATVSWTDSGKDHSVVATTVLSKWNN